MAGGKTVFIIGPGFLGWNVLDLLLEEGYCVTGLVRRNEHAENIKKSGAEVVIGDLHDHDKIVHHTSQSDIVIHTASANDLPSVLAILDGVKQRASKGQSTIYIHTSGTSVLDDDARGQHKNEKVYKDDTPDDVDSVSDDAPHRQIDLTIRAAHRELGDNARIAILIPPTIYGYNPKHKRKTVQIPTLTRFALKHGFSGYVGKGLPVESNIHVLDVAKAFITILHHMEQTSASNSSLKNPYWFCEATGDNEPSWVEIGKAVGEGLHKAGKIKDPTPREIPKDLYGDLFGKYTEMIIGLNSRSRANRLRALGWKPTEKDWRSSYLEDELPEILREDLRDFRGYFATVAN